VTEPATGRTALEVLRFLKAQLSTGAATLAEWACVWALTATGVWYVVAAVGGAIIGALLDFSIKKWWVFDATRRSAASEGVRYALVSGASALLFGGAVYALVDGLHLRMPVAVVAGSMFVGIFWNYPLHRFFVFSSTRAAGTPS
jgi:putative flippase GtrA